MTDEEKIKEAYGKVKNTFPSDDWRILFNAYNQENKYLSMSCRGCYFKVLSFIQKKFNLESKDFARNQSGHESTSGAVSQPGATAASPPHTGRKSFVFGKTGKTIFNTRSVLGRRPIR